MAVKVLITRHLKEGKSQEAYTLLNELRTGALNRAGYISGETLMSYDQPNKFLVVSTWDKLGSWRKWKANPLRKDIEKKLQPLLEKPTEYEEYVLGAYLPREDI